MARLAVPFRHTMGPIKNPKRADRLMMLFGATITGSLAYGAINNNNQSNALPGTQEDLLNNIDTLCQEYEGKINGIYQSDPNAALQKLVDDQGSQRVFKDQKTQSLKNVYEISVQKLNQGVVDDVKTHNMWAKDLDEQQYKVTDVNMTCQFPNPAVK